MMKHLTYLALNLLSIAVPFAYSFTARSGFSRKFAAAWGAITLIAVPMLLWDVWFTAQGVWGFNPVYHLRVRLFGLPIEEILFFFCIPFACLFIYDSVKKAPRLALPQGLVRAVAGLAGLALLLVASLYSGRAYTVASFVVAAPLLLALAAGHLRHRAGHIAVAWLIHLIPFFLVNGILTGLPVVWYNDTENLGIRLGTIPLEDMAYSTILLLGSIFVMEAMGEGGGER